METYVCKRYMWTFLVVSVYNVHQTDGLSCYFCPPTGAQTQEQANIECLSTSWEMSCADDQDRCYSRFYTATQEVEKGCARSQECVQTTSCCQTSFCNADPQTSKTGYGRPCSDVTDCIQGGKEMVCQRETASDPSKVCLCEVDSYQRGFTCKKKSYPNQPCTETRHCYDNSSTCLMGYCLCGRSMFGNGTKCDFQTGLGEYCQVSEACRGRHNTCLDWRCTCEFGYLVVNGTDHCSGSSKTTQSVPVTLLVLMSVSYLP